MAHMCPRSVGHQHCPQLAHSSVGKGSLASTGASAASQEQEPTRGEHTQQGTHTAPKQMFSHQSG